MPVTIDKFEYATDALARAAWWSGKHSVSGGTATADSYSDLNHTPANAIDGNLTTSWNSTNTAFPHWLRIDVGSGVSKIVTSITITKDNVGSGSMLKDFVFAGSNNGNDWTDLYSGTATNGAAGSQETFDFENTTAYRYYRVTITSNYWSGINHAGFREIAMYENYFTISSEATIKKEGSYSMKCVAAQTSLNQTLTRTVSPTINLTDQDNLKIWIRASRTGTNFKLGLHDSGGTTTESNIAISSADTWEEKTIDISAVANANKDAIDLITITVTNADAENTIYLDEMLAYVTDEGTGSGGGITNAINVSILTPSGWQKGI